MSFLQQYVADAGPYLKHYGYVAVALGIFTESFGLPLPGETLLIAGAVLASQGHMDVTLLVITAWAAAVLGDNVGYLIGYTGGRRLILKYGAHVGITRTRLAWVERFLRRFGRPSVAIARFFVVARQLNGLVAGAGSMPWWQFLFYNCIGALLWVCVWGLGVYYFGSHVVSSSPWIKYLGYAILGIIIVGALFMTYQHWSRRKKDNPNS